VWSNTIKGFGDSFGVSQTSGQDAKGVYIYRNRVSNSCDDLIEFDYGMRNIAMYDNLCTNIGTAVSLSYPFGGPCYAFRNVWINSARSPLKINGQSGAGITGFLIYNNTSVRTNAVISGWTGFGEIQYSNSGTPFKNYSIRNNLFIYRGTGIPLRWEAGGNDPCDMDHNAWFPDGAFNMNVGGSQINYTSLANARSNIPAVANVFGTSQRFVGDVITASNPFANAITLGADCMTEYTSTPDATLSASGPKNLGVDIPGITNGFSGAAPDMGAVISGRAVVTYGDTTGTPTWMSGLATLTWTSLPGTNPTSVGADVGTCAYSGAAFKASNSQLIVFGGGHGDSSNNGVYGITLSEDSPVARVLLVKGTHVNDDVPYQPDGKPTARHTWGDLAVDESVNRMITMQCSNPSGNSGATSPKRDGFNLATNTWLAAGTYSDCPQTSYTAASSCTKDAAGNIYWWDEIFQGLYKITPGQTSMTLTAASMPASTYNVCIACDTLRNRLVTFNSLADSYWYDLNNNYARTSITFSGAQSGAARDSGYWAYCPERDSFLGVRYVSGAAVIYECNASTYSVSTLSLSGTAPTMAADGVNNVYGRWGYASRLRGFYLLAQASSNVYFFRTG
jgi:hypothetical protein